MAPDYDFHPMSAADLALIRRWLQTTEVVRWWGNPEEQYALVSGDLDHPDMDQFIVALGDHPFGYIQRLVIRVPEPEGNGLVWTHSTTERNTKKTCEVGFCVACGQACRLTDMHVSDRRFLHRVAVLLHDRAF